MEFTDVKSLPEAQVSKKLEEIRASLPAKKLKDIIEWITKVPKTHSKLFTEAAATLGKIAEQTVEVKLLEKILVFLGSNLEKCEGPCAEHFFLVSFIAHAQENETLDNLAGEILQRAKDAASDESDETSQVLSPLLKTRIVPKLKEMAEAKNYASSFAVWRAIVRTTKLRISKLVTNDVLQIATMAFKENNPEYHALAFKSWKILIENLPPEILRKPPYIRLVLSPLNRTYRDTDANSTLQKYIAWWQHVLTLAEDAELNFDETVVPLLQRVFCMPSAKARQVNPTAFANPTRTIPQCAYTILALLWCNGDLALREELQQLGNPNFKINEHSFKVSCLSKHFDVFEDAITLIVNNITHRVCVPPKDYPFLLCRVLLSRINAFYENNHHDMVRLILSTVYNILKTKLDFEPTLKIFQDLNEHLPPRVMSSSQFNFRKGTFSMHECPVSTLTSFYISRVSEICHAAGGEANRKKFRLRLKILLDQGGKNMNTLRFTEHVIASLQDAAALEAESWQELSAFLKGYVEQDLGKEENFELASTTIPNALALPMRNSFPLTAALAKSWIELLTTTMQANARATDIAPNKQVAEICNRAHELISKSAYDLNRLLLISQMMESLLKHCDLQYASSSPDTTPTRRTRKLGNIDPFTKCLIEIIRKGSEQLKQEKPPKAACQFYVNVVEMVHTLLRDSKSTELCKEFILKLVPELGPILELTVDKTTMRNSPLFHVESALLTAVDHVLYALKTKSNDLPRREEPLIEVIRAVVDKLTNHWKASINETVQELTKTFSITLEEMKQFKRGLFGAEVEQPSTPRSSTKSRQPSDPKPQEESQPERKWTRSTPDASALRNGSARDKGTPKPAPASKRKSKVTSEEEFVPITSTKKKSEIYTEHQLEKLKEPKIIPSMYEDLSRSSQGTLMGPPTRLPEPKANLSTVEAPSPPTTPNGSHTSNGKSSTRASSRRSAPLTRNSSPMKLKEHTSSEDNLEFAFSGNSRETSPEIEASVLDTVAKDQNGENEKPKNEDTHSKSRTATMRQPNAETAVVSQEEESQRVRDPDSGSEPVVDNADKPKGALKRKLGKPSFSPIVAKLRPKRSSSNVDKSKSKRSKSDGERSHGIESDSMMDIHTELDPEKDARKSNLSKKPAPSETEAKTGNKSKAPPVKVERKRNSPPVKARDVPEKPSHVAGGNPSPDDEEVSQHSLVDRIKKAAGAQREELLKFISSPEFLQNMTPGERRSFLSAFFKNVSDYIL